MQELPPTVEEASLPLTMDAEILARTQKIDECCDDLVNELAIEYCAGVDVLLTSPGGSATASTPACSSEPASPARRAVASAVAWRP